MSILLPSVTMTTLKRDLILRFIFLLSIFMIMLIISYALSSKAISSTRYDNILLDVAGRQRMLIRKYTSEVNQALLGLATSNYELALSEKKKVDLTAKGVEKTHKAFIHGGKTASFGSGEAIRMDLSMEN